MSIKAKGQAFYQKLLQTNVPMAAFIVFIVHSTIVGFTIASSIAAFAICGLFAFRMFLDNRKKLDVTDELLRKLQYLESGLNAMKLGRGFRTTDNEEKPKKLF